MRLPFSRIASCLAIIILALAFRLPQLEQRTMHGDEAVHAIKFGELLEQGEYHYDPFEYHGPTLNYLTLIPAKLLSQETLAKTNEFTLRILPVFFGVLLVPLVLLFQNKMGGQAAFFAAIVTAISPAMVYYSRYYIQEILLVFFTLALFFSAYRYFRRPNPSIALLTGVFLGLLHATKETFVLPLAAALVTWLASPLVLGKPWRSLRPAPGAVTKSHLGLFAAGYALASILLFSSFFANPEGILDSFRTYFVYLDRAGSDGEHIHPWYYYLKLLLFARYGNGPVWSEALILILAGAGIIASFFSKSHPELNSPWFRLLSIFTLVLTFFYSAIPYKTPWNALLFLQALIMLAGVGAVFLFGLRVGRFAKPLIGVLILAGLCHLGWQSYQASFVYYEDSRNPYVYAHPVSDVKAIARRVAEISQAHPEESQMTIGVVCPGHDYWPLPWYLRKFPNAGWWDHIDDQFPSTSVVIASPDVERELLRVLYKLPPPGERNLYVPLFESTMLLRPAVEIRGYVRSDLWEVYQRGL